MRVPPPSLWGKRTPACSNGPTDPAHQSVRSDRYDAYYCPACDEWLEPPCSDPLCGFCNKRPAKPSEVTKS